MWEETRGPRENTQKHEENEQTPHTQWSWPRNNFFFPSQGYNETILNEITLSKDMYLAYLNDRQQKVIISN